MEQCQTAIEFGLQFLHFFQIVYLLRTLHLFIFAFAGLDSGSAPTGLPGEPVVSESAQVKQLDVRQKKRSRSLENGKSMQVYFLSLSTL